MTPSICLMLLLPPLCGLLQYRAKSAALRRTAILLACAGALGACVHLNRILPESAQAVFTLPLNRAAVLVLRPDDIGLFFALVFSVVWLVTAFVGFGYLEAHRPRTSRAFFLSYLLVLPALLGLCLAGNLLTYYLFFESMALLSILFITLAGGDEARRAAMQYLGYSIFGAGLVLFGMICLAPYGGDGLFAAGGMLVNVAGNEAALLPVLLVMLLGFGCKAGLLPLQGWLPVAHPIALTPGSAVLSGVITKSGVLGILRLCHFIFPAELIEGSWVQKLVLLLVLGTIFAGSMLAFREQALKRCLAFSTVSQVSYALLGVLLLSETALHGALLQVAFHALAKSILFLSAGTLISEAGIHRRDELTGLGRQYPLLFACIGAAALSMVGIPPFGGFFAKWFLCLSALEQGGLGVFALIVLMLSAALTAAYLFPMLYKGFARSAAAERAQSLPWLRVLPVTAALLLLPAFLL